ncbi:MAG TPA: helix-hairpin-helix domain-containing protein [Vicinamibacteria bacterium]|nr:helix-hairpin-helix domain-containing protein [Vicinamibacteria bacterium]
MKQNRVVAAALAVLFALGLSAGTALAASKPAPSGKVNINTATAEQLTAVPGIGDKRAARIVEYRQKNGSFKNVQELMNVKGVGEKSFGKLEPFLSTGGGEPKAASTR